MLKSNSVGIGQDKATFLMASITTTGIFGLGNRLFRGGLASHNIRPFYAVKSNEFKEWSMWWLMVNVATYTIASAAWSMVGLLSFRVRTPALAQSTKSNLNFEFEF
jgi:hypothetical protein